MAPSPEAGCQFVYAKVAGIRKLIAWTEAPPSSPPAAPQAFVNIELS